MRLFLILAFSLGFSLSSGSQTYETPSSFKGSFQSMAGTLQQLPQTTLVSQKQIETVSALLKNPKDPETTAIAFFTNRALIQAAQSSQALKTPLEKAKAQETFQLIENYARQAPKTVDKTTLSKATIQVSNAVKSLALVAATSNRVDLIASLLLQAKNYLRRIYGLSDHSAIDELELLFVQAKEESFNANEDLWSFDGRLLKAVQTLAPGSKTLQEAAAFWHHALKASHHEESIDLAADSLRSELYETMQALHRAIPQIRKQLLNQSGLIDRSFFGRFNESLATLSYLEKLFEVTSLRLRYITEPTVLERAWKARAQMKTLSIWALEASLSKSKTADEIATVIGAALSRLGLPSNDSTPFLSAEELYKIHQTLQKQNTENWIRAFINKEMAVVYAQSALLLGEAIAVPFTWGGSLAAMPTTLQAIVLGLHAVGKTTLIVNSTLSISDRYVQNGLAGLINPSSALDALTITMLLPRHPSLASWMHEASYFAVAGHAAFGAYQFANAEKISETLRMQGYQSSPEEIRQQALGHLAEAFLLGLCEWGSFSPPKGSSRPLKSLSDHVRYMVLPHEVFRDTFRSLSPLLGAPLAGAAATVPTMGYLVYDYVIANEALMFFFSGMDWSYFEHNQKEQEYPELKGEETAVSFIGFDQADLLYTGAHALDSHFTELKKYGSRYFVYDFTSPEDFLQKLSQHARTKGPIKYLRIMTHGLPGQLYTQAVSPTGSVERDRNQSAPHEGWLDAQWLRDNSLQIREVASNSMAPNARVVLFACLVGANMDSAPPGIKKTAGDDFLTALGETLLIKKGRVDSSIRFLMGLDTIFGSFMNWASREEFQQTEEARSRQPLLPVSVFRQGENGYLQKEELSSISFDTLLLKDAEAGPEWSDTADKLAYTASRLARMLTQLHKLGYDYGILLEGPWWSTPRYKHAQVTEAGVEITTH